MFNFILNSSHHYYYNCSLKDRQHKQITSRPFFSRKYRVNFLIKVWETIYEVLIDKVFITKIKNFCDFKTISIKYWFIFYVVVYWHIKVKLKLSSQFIWILGNKLL